jgi:hypothetical protein
MGVNLQASSGNSLFTPMFPTQITFSRITHTNQVSIRSVSSHSMPPLRKDLMFLCRFRRVEMSLKPSSHLKSAQAFAVGYVRRYGIRSTEQSFGVLRLLDQNSFECS